MARLKTTKPSLEKKTRAETNIERSTRAAREIVQDEAEKRALKTERLRQARLEQEAKTLKAK